MGRRGDGFITGDMTDRLGLTRNHFYVMKSSNIHKFRYIKALGTNIYEAYNAYMDEMIDVKLNAEDIYFWLEDRRKVSLFSFFLKRKGVYSSDLSYSNTTKTVLFNSADGFGTHRSFIKQKQILFCFDEFMKLHKDEEWAK